jgi:hypothetical protein
MDSALTAGSAQRGFPKHDWQRKPEQDSVIPLIFENCVRRESTRFWNAQSS